MKITGNFLFSSDYVSEGHPDKICDRISDAIVDTYLAAEPEARCGVETLATTNLVVLAGETRGPASITKDKLIEVARNPHSPDETANLSALSLILL
jgi:S-adenosylmethionine synthetase